MKNATKLLIVDDHVIFREGLVSLFNDQPDFEVVGEVGSVQEAIACSIETQPDLILMDIGLPDGNGVDATRAILAKLPEVKIVILTIHESDEMLFDALRSGAKGYILKNISVRKLVLSLRALDRGEAALSRVMTGRILDEFSRMGKVTNNHSDQLEQLTPRELEVLELLAKKASNRQIAKQLVISVNTVKNHLHNIYRKLDLPNRREAGKFARRIFAS